MPRLPILLIVTLVSLAACGEAPPDPWAEHGGDKGAAAGAAVSDVLTTALDTKLDDDVLGELLEIHREVLGLGDDVAAVMARGAGTRWDARAYGEAMTTWKAMVEATERGAEGVQKQIDAFAEGAPSLVAPLERMKALATPENAALVKKWKPRFDALEAEFD